MAKSHVMLLLDVPPLTYTEWCALQRKLVEQRAAERCADLLMFAEHEPVFTLGRTTKPWHWGGEAERLRALGYNVYPVERGGSVTYHGPGQIVVYPILRLREYCPGPKLYVRQLEEVIIKVLADWGIQGKRVDRRPGVWVDPVTPTTRSLAKIAAMGVRITRGITMHGFALNITVNLTPFSHIIPCGIEGVEVTSMAQLLPHPPDLAQVRERIVTHFARIFEVEWIRARAQVDRGGEITILLG
ncbi:MAG: lipoyl(octanoyl) transferase LipB [Nitrospirae bacterium]|nr:MAG: lipoyl(octanoyl) transferase LipB [Nitrospirota bacterium]